MLVVRTLFIKCQFIVREAMKRSWDAEYGPVSVSTTVCTTVAVAGTVTVTTAVGVGRVSVLALTPIQLHALE
jgi:hypothetical protein